MPRNRLSDCLRRVSGEEKGTKTVEREKRRPLHRCHAGEIRILREKLGRIEERRFPFIHQIDDMCTRMLLSSYFLRFFFSFPLHPPIPISPVSSRFSSSSSFPYCVSLRWNRKLFATAPMKYATKSRHDLSDCYKTYSEPSSSSVHWPFASMQTYLKRKKENAKHIHIFITFHIDSR